MMDQQLVSEPTARKSARPNARAAAAELPETMRAVAIERHGGPDAMALCDVPRPLPGPDEVLIALHTAGVTAADIAMRDGWSPPGATRFPFVLGSDGAGIVVAVGWRVRRLQVGQHVYACDPARAGFYAEYVAVAADKVAPVPRGLDLARAGAMVTSGLAALQGIDDMLHVCSGEQLVIHGAGGAVGSLALQFAKLRGARVFATASGNDGLARVRSLGADEAIDSRREDIGAALDAFAPEGVDAVLALAGGDALERCLDTVPGGGRLAYPSGIDPEPQPRRRIEVMRYDAASNPGAFERLGRAAQYARLQVPIAAAFALSSAAKAHQRLAAGVPGKLVLRILS